MRKRERLVGHIFKYCNVSNFHECEKNPPFPSKTPLTSALRAKGRNQMHGEKRVRRATFLFLIITFIYVSACSETCNFGK